MASDQNSEILSLKQQLAQKEQELSRLREEKGLLEESLDEQEENVKELRKNFQKRIDDLSNEIDEKDEQIDSMSDEISSLKNNNQVKDVDDASGPEVIHSLKEQLSKKDASIAEMKEKLNKGGMTINNLHMEIRELKEDLASSKDALSTKTATIKEMREENAKMKSSIFELQQKLDLKQTSSDSSEQTQDMAVGSKVQLEVLKKEIESKNEELMSTRIKLDKSLKLLNNSKEPEQISHSDNTTALLEENKLEKSKNSELQFKLDKVQSDLKKVVVFFACLVLAYALAKVVY